MSLDAARDLKRLARHIKRLYPKRRLQVALSAPTADTNSLGRYKNDPVGFAVNVLKYTPTPDQIEILKLMPGRVKVNAGHSIGKTSIAAVIVLWWFCTRDPCVVITTAPTERDVIDLLWTEIRLLAQRAGLELPFAGPRAPELFHHNEHWAKGYTARRGESFQGRHRPSMLFVFDECEGVDPIYWQVTDTMYQPGHDHGWLAIGNPVSTSSQSYLEDLAIAPDGGPKWARFTLSALNHPNVVAQLRGEHPPVPNAVTLGQVEQWIKDWSEPVPEDEKLPSDFEWPPTSNKWHRPGPLMKARVMGIRPTEGVNTVWGQSAWDKAITPRFGPQECWSRKHGVTIGCDVAVYGDDNSVIHVRTGPLSLHHESHNGWGSKKLADRLKELTVQWCSYYNAQASTDRPPLMPAQVKTRIELDGPGYAVLERCEGFGDWIGVSVAESSDKVDSLGRPMYYNKRAEMWFGGADRAHQGRMDLSRLPQDVLERLHTQLLTPAYMLWSNGSRQVEEKKEIKKRLKRSPDDADGLLVCYTDAAAWAPSIIEKNDDR